MLGVRFLVHGFVDSLLNHASTANTKGDSYRLREKRKVGLVRSALTAPSEL